MAPILPAAVAAGVALLHHGQYRGPYDEVLAATTAATGGPGGGIPPGALFDPFAESEGFERWEFWFEWNKDVLLRARTPRRERIPDRLAEETQRVDLEFARGEIVPVLLAVAEESDSHFARTALLALGKVGGKEALPPILSALERGTAETQRTAAIALGLAGEREGLSVLVDLFVDRRTPPGLRAAAALGMGLTGRREVAPILRSFLDHNLTPESLTGDQQEVMVAALVAAGMARDSSLVPVLIGRYRVLEGMRESRGRVLLGAILTTLGRLGDSAALGTLLEGLVARDIERRRSAALALGDLGDPASVVPLTEALGGDSDLQVRGFAAISLGRIGGEVAVRALREAYGKKGVSRTVRSFSALGLGLAGDRESAPALREALAAPGEEAMRGAFALALGLLGDTASAETLFAIVEDRGANPDLRGYAAIALGLLRPDGGLARLLRIAQEDADRVEDFRRGLLLGLGLFEDPRATEVILADLSSERRDVVRGAAVGALRHVRDATALESLAAQLGAEPRPSTPPDSALFACAALGALGDAYAYPLLAESFFNGNYRIRVPLLLELSDLL
jgi:HEAT repeat protein